MYHRWLFALFCLLMNYTPFIEGASWFAFVGNTVNVNSVTTIDLTTNVVGTVITGGGLNQPNGIAITPNNQTAYFVNSAGNSVTPIDIATNTVGSAITGSFNDPVGIAITPNGLTAYVTNVGNNSVTPIDLITNIAGSPISAVGSQPIAIAITPDGSTAYVVNELGNTVVPINLSNNMLGTPITSINFDHPIAIAMTPNGLTAYVVNSGNNSVVPINVATHQAGNVITSGDFNQPIGIAITPDGQTAYVVNELGNTVVPINLTTNIPGNVITSTDFDIPLDIAITPDGQVGYVINAGGNSVTPINLNTNVPGNTITGNQFSGPSVIAITPDQAPTAVFNATPEPTGLPTLFDASGSTSPVGSIASYLWDYGDGTIETVFSAMTTHTYQVGNTYTVTLTVTNSGGTSTTQVFTGQTMSRNGDPSAQTQQSILIQDSTTTTLTTNLNPSTFGQSVTFTATVIPSTAMGTVTFFDESTLLGSVSLTSGIATLSTSALAVGTHSLTAVYSGDANNASSTSAPLIQTVQQIPTITTLSSSSNPSTFGQSVTFTATISPAIATGSVIFFDGSTILRTVTVSGGTAAFATAALTVGSHSLTAVYSGDANNASSTSAPLIQIVQKATTTTTLSSSHNPSTFGQSVTFTATVVPAMATGTVTFSDGSTVLGTVPISNGSAALATSALTAGIHSLTATYNGNANFNSSTSPVFVQTVQRAATTTTLNSSPNPSSFGETVTLTATVSPAIATGTVTFFDGPTMLGTVALSNGTATFATSTFLLGTHPLTATYSGDTNFAPSTSAPVNQIVQPGTTATTLSSIPNPSTFGQNVTLTAIVSPAIATGTVTFFDGSTVLGTVTLSNGTAVFATSTLAIGMHSLTAVYSGDINFGPSTSPILIQTVRQSTTIALTSSINPSTLGQSVTFAATIAPATATGTVTFFDGSTVLGTVALSNGTAAFTTSALTTGMHTLTAVYSGDANNGSSTSPDLTQIVQQAATTTSLNSSPNPATLGQTVTLTASVTSTLGIPTGIVTFFDGTTVMGTAPLANGQAIFTTSAFTLGTHILVAVYGGDESFLPSTSNTDSLVVNLPEINPPTHLKGFQTVNRFATQEDWVNVISWKAPKSGTPPLSYKIFRDRTLTELAANISAHHKLKFEDHNRKQHRSYTYFIVSVDQFGGESIAASITVPK